ncbi:MAG TPA: hypothetical protein VK934_04635 [Fimbriimonas sp.]|nr:hypothetical protein [Fimbriimonas sp.]
MATLDDLREIAANLPGAMVNDEGPQFALSIEVKGKHKGFVWGWMERVEPKKPRVANNGVMAVSVPSLSAKEVIMSSNPDVYFSEPHYEGYPAVLVRLAAIERAELEDLVTEAWRCKSEPKKPSHKMRKPQS